MFWTNLLINVLVVIYVIDCIFMGLVIMMQRSKQEGLGAAFGGGFTESVWGAQTSQVLVKATVYAAIIFFILSIVLARLYTNRNAMLEQGSAVQQELLKPVAAPAKTTTRPRRQPLPRQRLPRRWLRRPPPRVARQRLRQPRLRFPPRPLSLRASRGVGCHHSLCHVSAHGVRGLPSYFEELAYFFRRIRRLPDTTL